MEALQRFRKKLRNRLIKEDTFDMWMDLLAGTLRKNGL